MQSRETSDDGERKKYSVSGHVGEKNARATKHSETIVPNEETRSFPVVEKQKLCAQAEVTRVMNIVSPDTLTMAQVRHEGSTL